MMKAIRKRSSLTLASIVVATLISTAHVAANEVLDPLQPAGVWSETAFGNAPLPPMGWNSWNAFHTQIDEAKLMGSAKTIVASGLRDLGYRYINIDDGWWQKRRQPDGRMVVRTSIFPSAQGAGPEETSFRPLVDQLHSMQLKAGIYTDIGRNACSQGYPQPDSLLPTGSVAEREVGSFDHVDQDMSLYFKEWGFDYVKVDGCGLNAFAEERPAVKSGQFRAFPVYVVSDAINQTRVADIRDLYGRVRDALTRSRPDGDFVFSICNWGTANVRAWGRDYGNLWRTSDDIEPRWSRMLYNFDSVSTRELFSGPGHWNDPDMLFVGHGDFDARHLTEARTHFALWAIEDAPLIIGYDLRQAPKSLLDIWGAAEIVAIDQDKAGNQGVIAFTSDDLQIIVKQLSNREEKAVVIVNRGTEPLHATLTAAHLKFSSTEPIRVRDLWSRRDLPPFTKEKSFAIAPRESVMLRVQGVPELRDGLYLSEMPARIYVAADGIRALEADPQIHRPVPEDTGTRGTGPRPALAGWGGPRADSTPYNNELRIRGTTYSSGIGALANSRLQIKADAEFKQFSAQVGLDDSTRERATKIRFEVYGDGRLLAQSPELGVADPAYSVGVDVPGVKIIELVAREIAVAHAPSVVTWGAAALTK
jgi:alpha-galactosidase